MLLQNLEILPRDSGFGLKVFFLKPNISCTRGTWLNTSFHARNHPAPVKKEPTSVNNKSKKKLKYERRFRNTKMIKTSNILISELQRSKLCCENQSILRRERESTKSDEADDERDREKRTYEEEEEIVKERRRFHLRVQEANRLDEFSWFEKICFFR